MSDGKVEVVDATKGDARPRDPELDALLKYLSEISETLETETDREVTASLLSTAVTELCSQIKGLLKWRKLSFIAERLLQDADFDTLAIFFKSISTDKEILEELITGEHSYFVIRAALKRYVRLVVETKDAVNNSNVKKCAKSLKDLTDLYCLDIIRRLRNKYSSLLFRNLIQTHCCIIYDDEKPIGNDGNPQVEVQADNIPKSNRKQFNTIIVALLQIENQADVALCEKASPSVGAVLLLCKIQRKDWCEEICTHFTPDKAAVNAYLKSSVGSFLLERLIFAMNEEGLKTFYDSWMRGMMEELVLHPQGNFLLQRLIIMSSDQLFGLLFQQLVIRGSLKQAWTNNKGGILARISERAIKLSEEIQTQVISDLKSSVCVRTTNIANALLVENDDPESFSVNYQGSLICQAMLQFHGRARKLLIDSLLELDVQLLHGIYNTSSGSFMLEKMSTTIPEKKFIEILNKLPISKIAFGRHGSRAVEGVWRDGSIKVRAALCECLKDVHAELGASQFGRHVNGKLRVTEYTRSQERWRHNQTATQKTDGKDKNKTFGKQPFKRRKIA